MELNLIAASPAIKTFLVLMAIFITLYVAIWCCGRDVIAMGSCASDVYFIEYIRDRNGNGQIIYKCELSDHNEAVMFDDTLHYEKLLSQFESCTKVRIQYHMILKWRKLFISYEPVIESIAKI